MMMTRLQTQAPTDDGDEVQGIYDKASTILLIQHFHVIMSPWLFLTYVASFLLLEITRSKLNLNFEKKKAYFLLVGIEWNSPHCHLNCINMSFSFIKKKIQISLRLSHAVLLVHYFGAKMYDAQSVITEASYFCDNTLRCFCVIKVRSFLVSCSFDSLQHKLWNILKK